MMKTVFNNSSKLLVVELIEQKILKIVSDSIFMTKSFENSQIFRNQSGLYIRFFKKKNENINIIADKHIIEILKYFF